MSKTSAEYQAGFAKLLPHVSSPRDIRAPGNEALAWRAMCALNNHLNYTGDVEAWNRLTADIFDAPRSETELVYAAIEAIGRTP